MGTGEAGGGDRGVSRTGKVKVEKLKTVIVVMFTRFWHGLMTHDGLLSQLLTETVVKMYGVGFLKCMRGLLNTCLIFIPLNILYLRCVCVAMLCVGSETHRGCRLLPLLSPDYTPHPPLVTHSKFNAHGSKSSLCLPGPRHTPSSQFFFTIPSSRKS